MYIARNKDGKFVSGTNKPYRIGTFKFKNSDFHKPNDDRYDWTEPIDAIIDERIDEYDIIRYNGKHVIFDLGEDDEIGEIQVTYDMFDKWSIKGNVKDETIEKLGLTNLTWEDGFVEI